MNRATRHIAENRRGIALGRALILTVNSLCASIADGVLSFQKTLSINTSKNGEKAMKERQLDFNQNEDETLVSYDSVKKKKVIKNINDLLFLSSHLRELVDGDNLKEGFKETCSKLLESYTADLLKEIGYDSVLEKEKKERHEKIRSLNVENRALRQQLGEKATAEDVRECLKIISEKINDFWDKEGFQFLKIKDFGAYGLRVSFHTSSLHAMWHGENAALEQHVVKLKGFGFELCSGDERKKDDALVFSSKNVTAFSSVLSRHFSNFKVGNIESTSRAGTLFIREIEVYFYDYDELINMPFNTYQDKNKVVRQAD